MLQHFQSLHDSLDVSTSQEETGGFLPNVKTGFRQKIVETAQRIVYSLQDAIVSSKYLVDGIGQCEDVNFERRPINT